MGRPLKCTIQVLIQVHRSILAYKKPPFLQVHHLDISYCKTLNFMVFMLLYDVIRECPNRQPEPVSLLSLSWWLDWRPPVTTSRKSYFINIRTMAGFFISS